jgi:hypothetical protein
MRCISIPILEYIPICSDGRRRSTLELHFMATKLVGILLLCLLGFTSGCSPWGASQSLRARSAKETARDNEVLDVVLSDMADNVDFRPIVSVATELRKIIVDDATYGGASRRFLETTAITLTPDVRSQLRDDILRRNQPGQRISTASFQPKSPSVVVLALNARDVDIDFTDRFPDARGYVRPFLPGFTADGQTAVFACYFGPSPHGAVGVYILTRENGSWKVKQKHLGHYN